MTVRPSFIGVINASGHTGLPHATSQLVISGGVAAATESDGGGGVEATLGLPKVNPNLCRLFTNPVKNYTTKNLVKQNYFLIPNK